MTVNNKRRRRRRVFALLYVLNFLGLTRMSWISFLNYIGLYVLTFAWIQCEIWEREIKQIRKEIEQKIIQRLGGAIGLN